MSLFARFKKIPGLTADQPLDAMSLEQRQWLALYQNKSPWLTKRIKSLNIAANLSASVAKLIALDFTSGVNVERIEEVYKAHVLTGILDKVEYGLALGGIILKPYVAEEGILVDTLLPSNFNILAHTSDIIKDIEFYDYAQINDDWYVRVERHLLDLDGYHITNRVFKTNSSGMYSDYDEVALGVNPLWAGLYEALTLQNVVKPLFGYFKPAMANHFNLKSYEGVSLFSRAVDLIQINDEQLSGLLREFRVKEAKQYVSHLAVKSTKQSLPYLQDDYYIKLNMHGKNDEDFFESYSPDINSKEYIEALNEYKKLVEDACGIAHGTISDPALVARTATEIMTTKHRTYETVILNQRNLAYMLESVAYAIAVWEFYPQQAPDFEFAIKFEDSIIIDKRTQLQDMKADVESGLLKPELYLMKKYGWTEEQAKENMPGGIDYSLI